LHKPFLALTGVRIARKEGFEQEYLCGIAETINPEMDGKWNAATLFFPTTAISNEHLLIVGRSI